MTNQAFIFLACTNLLISLKVVSMAGLGRLAFNAGQPPCARHSSPSWPSLAAFMYRKNLKISGLSDAGFLSSFSSLKLFQKLLKSSPIYKFFSRHKKKNF